MSNRIGMTHCAAYGCCYQAQSLSASEMARSTADDQLLVGCTVQQAHSPKEEMSRVSPSCRLCSSRSQWRYSFIWSSQFLHFIRWLICDRIGAYAIIRCLAAKDTLLVYLCSECWSFKANLSKKQKTHCCTVVIGVMQSLFSLSCSFSLFPDYRLQRSLLRRFTGITTPVLYQPAH